MIYKCKNCGTEFKVCPDYCDCGNNTFDKIGNDTNPSDEYDEFGEKIVRDDFKISPENNKDLSLLYKPDFEYTKNSKDENTGKKKNILPVIVFVLSLIISAVLLLTAFLMPSKNKNNGEPTEQKTKISKPQVQNVNDFWDDTPAQIPDKTVTKPAETVKQNDTVQTKQEPVSKPTAVNPQKETPKTAPKTANQVKKPQKTEVKTETPKAAVKKPEKKQNKPTESKNQTNTVKEDVKPAKPAVSQEDIKAVNIYKTNLRAALFSVFPILNVQGSGTATVAFSVGSDGKLLNRRFVSQSDNKSLNDAMYHMLMKTPTYRIPPSAYKGEEFVLEMRFNNGQYSFSYVK